MTYRDEPENEGHAEAMQNVAAGSASILSDEDLPGGRFQTIATVFMGEFVLTAWHQKPSGDWVSGSVIMLKRDATARLVSLLHSSGLASPLKLVE